MKKTRKEARAAGDLFYHGRAHKCGRTKRYVSDSSCVRCTDARARKVAPQYAARLAQWGKDTGAAKARAEVRRAIKRGNIPSLKDRKTKCTDCGLVATEYDHRDYNRRLDVAPVCRSCNLLRGPAISMTAENKRRVSA